jgi:hypothetical protein
MKQTTGDDLKRNRDIMRESFRHYRQAGLGLSATFISLSIILLHELPEGPSGVFCGFLCLFLCKLFLGLSIISAVAIQVALYIGWKAQAHAHLLPVQSEEIRELLSSLPETENVEEKHRILDDHYNTISEMHRNRANKYFGQGDWLVNLTIIFFLLGLITWLIATRYLF